MPTFSCLVAIAPKLAEGRMTRLERIGLRDKRDTVALRGGATRDKPGRLATGLARAKFIEQRLRDNTVIQPFTELPKGHFGAILADPPWHFEVWSLDKSDKVRHPSKHYATMPIKDIYAMPVESLTAVDCVLFMWVTWPMLEHGLQSIESWGFKYKTCAFSWMKANGKQVDMFAEDVTVDMLTGYWTRANSEVCLLATKGKPKRLNADVRQGIIAPRREHSRKPDGIHERIERLVAGPYLELFARQKREGWTVWGNQTDKFRERVGPNVEAELLGSDQS